MKPIILILTFAFSFGYSQNTHHQIVKDSTSVSKILDFGNVTNFNGYDILFKEVIVDSRCPKSVSCVRAGEAFVLVSISKNGKYIKDQKLRIDASGFVTETNNLVFSSKEFSIYGYSLMPYPQDVEPIKLDDYSLELVYRPNVN